MTNLPPERILDARGLEPPEPLERTLEALDTLQPAERLRVLLPREPFPLYAILDRWGYRRQTEALPDGSFAVLIWRD
ncbi:MAG: DUF2249 domain-containing protein [Burkholderiales bacterium]|jgi:uncharacterized protein (DUF2249 family)|nr:DUF2249 domain-containing protein [Burkholderiales bacterium]